MAQTTILDTLFEIHSKYRLKVANVSEHTISAQKITKKWQSQVIDKKNEIEGEVGVNKFNNEKIDLVDRKNGIAYELKVSGKNCHHEFYKDLIKVLTYNLNKVDQPIKKFIFISEMEGIEVLRNRLDDKLISLMNQSHNIEIDLISIP